MFNTEQSLYLEDSFDGQFSFDDRHSFGVQPKTASYNFQTISRRREQAMPRISNEVNFQTSPRNRTSFETFGCRGAERITQQGYYGFGSVINSPTYAENGVCGGLSDDLDLTAGMGNDTTNPRKDTVFDACPTQGIHKGGRRARATLEPIKKVRRVRANDRERRRMKSLNRALESLKKCIPVPQSKRRVTKLEVLRIACNYIRSLSETLSDESDSPSCPFRKRGGKDTVVNGFSIAQRLEILSGSGGTHI